MSFTNKRLGTDSFPGRLNEARIASTAGGGTALSTTAVFIALPNKTSHGSLYTRNFASAAVVKFALNPYLLILVTGNGLKSVTDYSVVGQNNPADATGVNLNALDVQGNGGAFYIGSHVPFRGIAVTNGNANSNPSVLTGNFWNGSSWVAFAGFTDGTASGGKTQAQSGNIIWTVPTTWATALLSDTEPQYLITPISGWGVQPGSSNPMVPVSPIQKATLLPYNEKPRYWAQFVVSAQLSATVNNTLMLSMNRNTANYAEAVSGVFTQFRTFKGPDGLANVEALTDAGTANLIVNVYNDNELGSF